MNVVLWIVAGVAAVGFIGAGSMKLTQPKAKLKASGMGWTDDFSAGSIRLIGAAEVLGGIGLILPAVTGIAPILVPIAATCLALTMVGAIGAHLRRSEIKESVPALVLLVLAAVVAWGRFGPYQL